LLIAGKAQALFTTLRAVLLHQHLPIVAYEPGMTAAVMELIVNATATAVISEVFENETVIIDISMPATPHSFTTRCVLNLELNSCTHHHQPSTC
jgi:hypothetical protein